MRYNVNLHWRRQEVPTETARVGFALFLWLKKTVYAQGYCYLEEGVGKAKRCIVTLKKHF